MAQSFFGGDPNVAHFTCHLSIKDYPIRSDARREAYAKIKETFGREKYFQFRVKDETAKVVARKQCEAHAADIKAKTGISAEVSEGFFL